MKIAKHSLISDARFDENESAPPSHSPSAMTFISSIGFRATTGRVEELKFYLSSFSRFMSACQKAGSLIEPLASDHSRHIFASCLR